MVILVANAWEELWPNIGYLLDKEPYSVPYCRYFGTTACRVLDGPDYMPTGAGE
jgi:hypothetical protein